MVGNDLCLFNLNSINELLKYTQVIIIHKYINFYFIFESLRAHRQNDRVLLSADQVLNILELFVIKSKSE